jgi:hypothetical protein
VLRTKAGAALLAGCSAIGVLVAGCGDDSPEMSSAARDPAEELSAAVDRTLALDSFRIVGSTEAGDDSRESQASYQAPDRAQLVSFDGTITIYDGDEIYTTTPDADGRFVRIPAANSGAQPVEQLLRPLHMLEAAAQVRREGDRYVVGLEGADDVIVAEIEDGLVTYIRGGGRRSSGRSQSPTTCPISTQLLWSNRHLPTRLSNGQALRGASPAAIPPRLSSAFRIQGRAAMDDRRNKPR